MTLLLLEALGALLLFMFIVWWTMFAGRKRGEPPDVGSGDAAAPPDSAESAPGAASKANTPPQP